MESLCIALSCFSIAIIYNLITNSETLNLLGEAEGLGRDELLLYVIWVIGNSVKKLSEECVSEYFSAIELLTYERISTLRWACTQYEKALSRRTLRSPMTLSAVDIQDTYRVTSLPLHLQNRNTFNFMDANGDGYLSLQEMKDFFHTY